jgi:predicted unusual protein kinase regulating ubiquinone biosynthesis (AarF/ABC1/UbiB family)
MGLSLRPQHLKHYKDLAWLLWKYGRSDLVKHAGLDEVLSDEDTHASPEEKAKADCLADDLEKMGPTYIKLGQLLSTRPELIPPAYIEALARLQDKVEPFPFAEVEKIIGAEIGVRISRAFQEIDPKPLAAASIGQVHRAILRDGRHVAVKVQRPGIRERMIEDLDVLGDIADFLDAHTEAGRKARYCDTLNEFRKMLLRELDYRQEAQNLTSMRANLAAFPRLLVPQAIEDYSTSKVLTMDYVSGQKITSLSPVVRIEVDGEALAEELFKAYLQQILVDGFFHADPHPGNVLLTNDFRLAILDLGMVARISPMLQEDLLQLVLAVAEGRSDDAVEFALKNGDKLSSFDEKELRRRIAELVGRERNSSLKKHHVGTSMMEIHRIAEECGVRLPPEMALIGKTLMNLDQIGEALSPTFDPSASVRRNASHLMQQRLLKSFAPGNLFARTLEMKEFAQRLPHRVNRIMDAIANNELSVNVDAIDETYLMAGFQKVANRITLGLILAALIIGAALLMRVDTAYHIFGYPALAIIFFLLAAGGACVLMFQILFRDESSTHDKQ